MNQRVNDPMFSTSDAIKAQYLASGQQSQDVDAAIGRLMSECGELFSDSRAAWEFLMEETHEDNEEMDTEKSYRTEVRTDSDYDDIPTLAVFSIGEDPAKEIITLAALVKAHGLYKVEKFGYRTSFYNRDPEETPEDGTEDEENEVRTDCDCLCVSDTEFWFSACIKHTNVEVVTERQNIAELASYFDLDVESNDNETPEPTRAQEAFAGHLAFDGVRIDVGFQAPCDATQAEKDAAFMGALAQHAEIDYLAVGSIAG